MPSLARRVGRRVLPQRIRKAGLVLIGWGPPQPSPEAAALAVRKAKKRAVARRKARRRARAAEQIKVRNASAPKSPGRTMIEVLRRGGALPAAVEAETRDLLRHSRRDVANSVAATLQRDPSTASVGKLAAGIVAARGGFQALAWSCLGDLPAQVWATHAAEEFLNAGLTCAPDHALGAITVLLDAEPTFVPPTTWLAMIGPLFGYGHTDLANRAFEVLDSRVGDGSHVASALVVHRDWLRRWVGASSEKNSAPALTDGSVSWAILDYGHPGRLLASSNIGDHVQSLASLGHLARHQMVSYGGPQDLVDLMTHLRNRVRPDLQRSAVEAQVTLMQVDRDASTYSAIPPNTWTLAFGWYMHAIVGTRYDFPFHPNLLPIFVSFHCSRRELLTDAAIEYLQRFGPIGCRDWTTVDLLLSVGVPAFFSGCLTTTVRTVFVDPLVRPGQDAPIGYVDMPPDATPKNAPRYKHSDDAIRFRSFATNVYDAIELLETYRSGHRGLVTSRLHCYLPVRSLGVQVDFQPRNRSDPRFAGLIDITEDEFNAIQARIDERLEQVLTMILGGRPSADVYEYWKKLNAEDVAAAERRRAADHPLPAIRTNLLGELAQIRSDPVRKSTEVAVGVSVQSNAVEATRVLIGSVAENATVPLHFHLVTRDSELDTTAFIRAAGDHRLTMINTAGIGQDLRAAGRSPAALDVDRLVLLGLLPLYDRLILLPAESVVYGDVAELSGLPLDGQLLAAADPAGRPGTSGFGVLNQAANRLQHLTASSSELRRRAYARHRFDFDAFDIDVLVVDLTLWRKAEMLPSYLPYVEEFGLTVLELLHLMVGPNRARLPERWHAVPGRSVLSDPALVHWRESTKPWSPDHAVTEERWYAARQKLEADPLHSLV